MADADDRPGTDPLAEFLRTAPEVGARLARMGAQLVMSTAEMAGNVLNGLLRGGSTAAQPEPQTARPEPPPEPSPAPAPRLTAVPDAPLTARSMPSLADLADEAGVPDAADRLGDAAAAVEDQVSAVVAAVEEGVAAAAAVLAQGAAALRRMADAEPSAPSADGALQDVVAEPGVAPNKPKSAAKKPKSAAKESVPKASKDGGAKKAATKKSAAKKPAEAPTAAKTSGKSAGKKVAKAKSMSPAARLVMESLAGSTEG